MMESPDEASETACSMVLQAVWADLQSLLSLPFTPSTYHLLLASAVGARAKNKARNTRLLNPSLCLIILLPSGQRLGERASGGFLVARTLRNGAARIAWLQKPEPRKRKKRAARKRL